MQLAVFGLGYVGSVSAACLAHLGHDVVGVERDPLKVDRINHREAPLYEPGLTDLIREGVDGGRLRATCSVRDGLRDADVALVCVGTPSDRDGNLDVRQLRRVTREIVRCASATRPPVIAVRSTVFPGTCEEVVLPELRAADGMAVVAHPEFLREGEAVGDFLDPALLVAGGTDAAAVERVVRIYGSLKVTPCRVSLRAAEMIKYACNAYHATKIALANEIGALSARLGIDGAEIMNTVCMDTKLNVSTAYLRPGFAFGGSCLPKDLRALTCRAAAADLTLPLLASILPSNATHLQRAVRQVLDRPGRVGVIGLAFKDNTDDLRESPVVAMVEQLARCGRDIKIFDPIVRLECICGSNKAFILDTLPHIRRMLADSLEEVLEWAEYVVIARRPAADLRARLAAARVPILDLGDGGVQGGHVRELRS